MNFFNLILGEVLYGILSIFFLWEFKLRTSGGGFEQKIRSQLLSLWIYWVSIPKKEGGEAKAKRI